MRTIWTVHKYGFLLHCTQIEFQRSAYSWMPGYAEHCSKLANNLRLQSYVMCHLSKRNAEEYFDTQNSNSERYAMWTLQVPNSAIRMLDQQCWEWIIGTSSIPDQYLDQYIADCPSHIPRSSARQRAIDTYHQEKPSEDKLWEKLFVGDDCDQTKHFCVVKSPIDRAWVLSVNDGELDEYIVRSSETSEM